MTQYRQTAADLHNLRSPQPAAPWEPMASIALAIFLGTGIAAAIVYWWSM
jgi:hypothetical protein